MNPSYFVAGMTCGHCASAVKKEIGKLDGVSAVEVDLMSGGHSRVTVFSVAPLSYAEVHEAVDEAGYDLVEAGQ